MTTYSSLTVSGQLKILIQYRFIFSYCELVQAVTIPNNCADFGPSERVEANGVRLTTGAYNAHEHSLDV